MDASARREVSCTGLSQRSISTAGRMSDGSPHSLASLRGYSRSARTPFPLSGGAPAPAAAAG